MLTSEPLKTEDFFVTNHTKKSNIRRQIQEKNQKVKKKQFF